MSKRKTLTLPKHWNPSHDRTACAPYNFVPLPEKVVLAVGEAKDLPDHDTYADEKYLHTGYFAVKLTTRSPLYVRCPLRREEFDLEEQDKDRNGREINKQTRFSDRIKNTPHFFYTRDAKQPVIPGSSLRGMLRNLLEIVSYSKMQGIQNKPNIFYRAVAADRYDPLTRIYKETIRKVETGYLLKKDGDWYVQPAKRPDMDSDLKEQSFLKVKESEILAGNVPGFLRFNHQEYIPQYHRVSFDALICYNDEQRAYVTVTSIGSADAGYKHLGVLVCSGNMLTGNEGSESLRKRHTLVLEADKKQLPIKISQQTITDYQDALTLFQQEAPFDKTMGCLREGNPIFYIRDHEEVVFFGHTPNFRLPAVFKSKKKANTPLDFVPEQLNRPEDIGYAEALFGHTLTRRDLDNMKKRKLPIPEQGSKTLACASRISVTDAILTEAPTGLWFSGGPVTPTILATPKPTPFQHYLVQTSNSKPAMKHYGSSTPEETVIRGHKLYWHQGNRKVEDLKPEPNSPNVDGHGKIDPTSTQHTQFKPVNSGVTFTFYVHFENLSDDELGALCWTLYPLGDEGIMQDESRGYCHSLGMGKPLGMGAVILNATLHLSDRRLRYSSLFEGNGWATGFSGEEHKLSDRGEVVKKMTDAFELSVLKELEPFEDNKTCARLADLKRIAMLLKMLEWPGFPSDVPATEENRKRTSDGSPNTRYMTIDLPGSGDNEYKDRPVLPDSSAGIFGALTGYVEPSTDKGQLVVSKNSNSDAKFANEEATSESLPLEESHQAGAKETAELEPSKKEALTVATPPSAGEMATRHSPQAGAKNEELKSLHELHPATLNILEDLKKTEAKPRQEQAMKTVTSELVVLVAYSNPKTARVRTEQGEDIECVAMPNYPKLQANDSFRARVTRQSGGARNAVFYGWK